MGAQDINLRDQPAYGLAEAARYLKLPAATLRSWVVGRAYPKGEIVARFQPLIKPARKQPPLLSFYNLIEAHVLRSLRTEHGVAIRELRKAIKYAERTLKIERLLLNRDLRTHAGQVFLDEYGKLINLSTSGQLAMRRLLEEHLRRVEWDNWQFPVRLYPYVSTEPTAARPIVIDPSIAFGRPVVLRAGVSTGAIAEPSTPVKPSLIWPRITTSSPKKSKRRFCTNALLEPRLFHRPRPREAFPCHSSCCRPQGRAASRPVPAGWFRRAVAGVLRLQSPHRDYPRPAHPAQAQRARTEMRQENA
ncbi:MAG: hypothetical protein ACREUA_09135 [Burkholderiales bacterium]